MPKSTICGELNARGEPCLNNAGHGTNHVGIGPCSRHDKNFRARGRDKNRPDDPILGSDAKVGKDGLPATVGANRGKKYAEKMARPSLEMLVGFRVEVEPHEAMLMCINIASAEVTFYTAQIAMLEAHEIIGRPKQEMLDKNGKVHDLKQQADLNIWIKARNQAMDRLAKFCKMAIDIGLQERQVAAAERYGLAIARMVEGILGEINLTPEQQEIAPAIVRKHLTLASTGSPAPSPTGLLPPTSAAATPGGAGAGTPVIP